MTAEVTALGVAPGARRSSTGPTRITGGTLMRTDELPVEGTQIENLFTHPSVKVYSFGIPRIPGMPQSPAAAWRSFSENPTATPNLPWKSATEQSIGFGAMRIERKPGSNPFMRTANWGKPILHKTECWCVDGVSKFAMRVNDLIYRIELPYTNEEEEQKVEELKGVFDSILQYEKTRCPFKRGFTVDVSEESAVSPLRNKFIMPATPIPQREYSRRTTIGGIDGRQDGQPSPSNYNESSSDEEPELSKLTTDKLSAKTDSLESTLNGKGRPKPRDNFRSVTAPSILLPVSTAHAEPTPPISAFETNENLVTSDQPIPHVSTESNMHLPPQTHSNGLTGPAICDEKPAPSEEEEEEEEEDFNRYDESTLKESDPAVGEHLPEATDQPISHSTPKLEPPLNLDPSIGSVSEQNFEEDLASNPILSTNASTETQPGVVTADKSAKVSTATNNSGLPVQRKSSSLTQRPSTPPQRKLATVDPIHTAGRRSREDRGFLSTLIFTIYAILMAPPSNLLTILKQLVAKIFNRLLNPAASDEPSEHGYADPNERLPGQWEDSDMEESVGRDSEDEDDYGVPVGNKTPQRLKRRKLGSGMDVNERVRGEASAER